MVQNRIIDPTRIMVQNIIMDLNRIMRLNTINMDHSNNLVSDSKITGPEVKDQGHPEVIETIFKFEKIWII